jgi:glutathione synthase
MILAIAMQRGARLTPTWTTLHLAHAALASGHRVWFLAPEDVEIGRRGVLLARVGEAARPPQEREELAAMLLGGALQRRHVELGRAQVLLLRLNPLSAGALVVAMLAREAGVEVVNDPAGLALTRSKAWLATLTDVPRPSTTVTRSMASAAMFAAELDRDVVVKPAQGSGGRGVTRVARRDRKGLERAVEAAIEVGDGTVVVQEYLEAADQGEKRLVWMDGELLGAYLRQRAEGEFRHNLRQGGQPRPARIEAEDRRIAALLRPHLERNGIRIAGLDVIGGRVVEVNCLNPGGVHYASHLQVPQDDVEQVQETIAHRMIRRLAETCREPDVATHHH